MDLQSLLDSIARDVLAAPPPGKVAGILTILPGRGCLCVWGPALDKSGNSAAGVAALDEFTTRTGWSIF